MSTDCTSTPSSSHVTSLALGSFSINCRGASNGGGLMHRMRGQLIPRKKGCCLISLAPEFDPKRLAGSLFSNALINCLAARLTGMLLGNVRSLCNIFPNVFCLFFPLKGVRPYNISYSKIPEFKMYINKRMTEEERKVKTI
uniref:Putative LOV domain-containing protein n=1 Tax=Rhizophora mucronata TaxID=61149 RepID=A0A2P2MCB5_RHIMU